jgi:hypothetical protein
MKPSVFQVRLVLEHAVLWYAGTVERGSESAQAADEDSVFEAGGEAGSEITEHDDVPHDRNGQEKPAKEKPPESAPKGATGAPEFDAIARIVEADDLSPPSDSLCRRR